MRRQASNVGDEIDESGERETDEPDRPERSPAATSEQVSEVPDRRGPNYSAERVPENKPAPGHSVCTRQPGGDNPEAWQPTCEKHGSRTATGEELLPALDETSPRRRFATGSLEQPTQPDQVADVVAR
jgi:hypothetical protein